ncbi:hypothetical protein [Microbacterium sp. MYb64]|uniref:hypothetical protein n=1 Tax=Microbacterium sp. MYb64 TaxID=1848691 RepID=UPI000CFABF61|nr:hypothetical protein [Microbacterium sp. MYb64]PRB07504.1 hypothetical protein CQ044_05300 [Microbacterium sp. MYb64]
MENYTEKSPESGAQGVKRRTVIKGAAWSVPVLAAAVATPAHAASTGGVVITPGSGPHFVGACSPAQHLTFTVTDSGNKPLSGTQVSVALPAGWHWSDNTTGAKIFTSDPTGVVTVTGAVGGSTAGAATIVGTVLPSGPSAAVPVTVTGTIAREVHRDGSNPDMAIRDMGGIPEGSTAIAWDVFLGPDGTLYTYHQDSGYSVVDTGVVDIAAHHYTQLAPNPVREIDILTYLTSDGTGKTWTSEGGGQLNGTVVQTGVPAGTKVVGWNSFLYPNGDLSITGTTVATGVTSAVVQHEVDSAGTVFDYATFVTSTGVHTGKKSGAGVWTAANNFATPTGDAKAIGWNFSLRPNGDLYYQNQLIAQNVTSAEGQHTTRNTGEADLVTYVQADGTGVSQAFGTGASKTTWVTNFGPDAKVVGWKGILTGSGNLYNGDELLDTQVVTADSWHERTSAPGFKETDWFAWTRGAAC